jgi:hypothetical protein
MVIRKDISFFTRTIEIIFCSVGINLIQDVSGNFGEMPKGKDLNR